MLKITKNQGSIQVTADKSGFYPFDGTITFPTNSLFTATSANTDMITFKSTSNGDVQFVGNYKDITISGRSYDTKQKFLTAFSNLANQGSVDAYTKAETDAKLDAKQGKLKAGSGITLTEDATDGTTVVKTKLNMDRGPFNDDGIKIGRAAQLETSHGIAFGDESLSKRGGIAIGNKAQSWGISSIVIGKNSSDQNGSTMSSGVVIGNSARGVGAGVVIGNSAHGGSAGAVIGYSSTVDGNGYGYAIGDNVHISETTKMVPIAIGYGAEADETKPLAITILKVSDTDGDGNYEMKYCDFIQGDANGKISLLKGDGTDTRMVIQDEIAALKNAGGSGGSANPLVNVKGRGNATIADSITDGVAIGSSANVTQENAVAIGRSAASTGTNSIAIGYSTSGSGESNIAIGNLASSSSSGGIAIGDKAETTNMFATAIGNSASAYLPKSLAIGYRAKAKTDTPMVINAGGKTMIQGDANGKLSILKGDGTDERMVIQDEIEALKNAGGGGTVDAYTKAETDNLLNAKQNTLTAGTGITIDGNNTISLSGVTTEYNIGYNHVYIGNEVADHFEIATTPFAIAAIEVTNSSGESVPMPYLQGDNDGKISIPLGDGTSSTMCLQDEIEALKNAGGGSANPLVNVKGTVSAIISENLTEAIAIGSDAKVTQENSVAIGSVTKAFGGKSVAVGYSANSIGEFGVGIGTDAKANGGKSVAVGYQSTSNAVNGVGIGYGSNATTDMPLVIKAGVDGNGAALPMIQGYSNGKLSILKGDGTDTRMVIQDEITALKAEITTLKAEIAALKGGASTGA